jgi:ABC-2 type transport system permease protein
MRKIWIIAKREFSFYFSSPVAYLVMVIIFAILGVFFYRYDLRMAFEQQYVPSITNILGLLGTLLVLTTPALTARLFAEERRMGTIELLLTTPIRDIELVIGKWLGAFLYLLTIVAISFIYPIILNYFVDPGIDQGVVFSGYLALILLCASLASIGVAVSTLFNSQVAAFFSTIAVLIVVWWIIGPISNATPATSIASTFIGYLGWSTHFFDNFMTGVIDLRDVIFFISVTIFSIFFATLSVETRRVN